MLVTVASAFAVSLAAALLATPVARKLAVRLGVFDSPGERKVHVEPVPYLGGLAIIVAFMATVLAGAAVRGVPLPFPKVAAIFGGAILLAAIGLWDDLKVVPGWIKVPTELALAAVLYAVGIRAQLFHIFPLDLVLSIGWVIGITNAVNYMDNMDGLSAGVAAIAAGYFCVLAVISGHFAVAGLSAALAGCALGFLWYNRPPARIFMGDAGTLFLGFFLAALGLDLRFENIARVTFLVPVAVMGLPILDALLVSISRVRRGLSPIRPGRDHISHRMVNLGIPSRAAVLLLYCAAAASGWIGLVIAHSRPLIAYMLMGWILVMGAFLGGLLLKVEPKDWPTGKGAGDLPPA